MPKSKPKTKGPKIVSPKASPSVVGRRPRAVREDLPEDIISEEMGEDAREEIPLEDEEDEADLLEKSEDVLDDNGEYPRT